MPNLFEKTLAFLAWSLICMSVGWWFRGHPDKLFQYTGFVGDYVSSRWVEHAPSCPGGYALRQSADGSFACDRVPAETPAAR